MERLVLPVKREEAGLVYPHEFRESLAYCGEHHPLIWKGVDNIHHLQYPFVIRGAQHSILHGGLPFPIG